MMADRFTQECPGLAGSLRRLYGQEVADEFAQYYREAADLGGNDELGVVREDGVSFNARIARVVSLVIQECPQVSPRVLKAAAYSTVAARVDLPPDLLADVITVRDATSASPEWVVCIALVLMLDRIRHLHMADIPALEKTRILSDVQSSPLLASGVGSPENLRLKLIHGIEMQRRRIKRDAEG
jgi:hypothetical protein